MALWRMEQIYAGDGHRRWRVSVEAFRRRRQGAWRQLCSGKADAGAVCAHAWRRRLFQCFAGCPGKRLRRIGRIALYLRKFAVWKDTPYYGFVKFCSIIGTPPEPQKAPGENYSKRPFPAPGHIAAAVWPEVHFAEHFRES